VASTALIMSNFELYSRDVCDTMSKKAMRTQKWRGLLAMLMVLTAGGVSGCAWDNSLYDEMVSAIGSSEAGSCKNISYIQLESGRITVRCPRTEGSNCEVNDLIVEGGRVEAYQMYRLNFDFEACPEQLACRTAADGNYCSSAVCGINTHDNNGFCENDTIQNCGAHGRVCSEIVSNWADGVCINAECQVSNCIDGYKIVNNTCVSDCVVGQHYDNEKSSCVSDDEQNCGATGNDCLEQIKNSSVVSCTEGKCKVISCAGGYTLDNNTCASSCNIDQHYDSSVPGCVNNDINNCGQTGFACTDKVQNWSNGECIEGNCVLLDCVSGFKVVGNECKADCNADEHYDSQTAQCEKNDINNCGQTGYSCSERVQNWMTGTCENGMCSVTNCATGFKPSANYDACVSDCSDGQHYDSEKSQCVNDDNNNCGQTGYSCSEQIKNSSAVSCNLGKCVVTACKSGYKVSNNACASDCSKNQYYDSSTSKCVDNSTTDCGQKGYDCSAHITNWATGNCSEGSCLLLTCRSGYKVSNNACLPDCTTSQYYDTNQSKCVSSSVKNCGRAGNDCSKLAGWVEGSCTKNNCQAKSCASGYSLNNGICEALTECGSGKHLYKGDCEADDIYNCGAHNVNCSSLAGWAEGSCQSSSCVATKCNVGYSVKNNICVAENVCGKGLHEFNNSCEADSLTNCGSHGNNCETKPGWAKGVCSAGQCFSDWCQDNYHTKNGECVKDSDSECGYSRDNCLNKSATASTASWKCNSGYCTASSCNNGYALSSENVCIPTSSGGGGEQQDCDCNSSMGSGSCVNSKTCTYTSCADGYYLVGSTCQPCGCSGDGSIDNKCSNTGVCSCKTGYAGDKCDSCNEAGSFIVCSKDSEPLKCMKTYATGWTEKYPFNTKNCIDNCSKCESGKICQRNRKNGDIDCK